MSDQTQAASIRAKVAEGLKNSGEAVAQGVADQLVEKELNRRKDLISKALVKLDDLEKEQKKFKPDNNIYGEDESIVQEGWKKETLDARKKNQAKIDKLNKAIDDALNNNNYKGLEDQLK